MKSTHCVTLLVAGMTTLLSASLAGGQQPDTPAPKVVAVSQEKQPMSRGNPSAAGERIHLTLQQALELARKNEPQYGATVTQAGLAREDRVQARDGLLPSVNFNTSDLYTQSNRVGGTQQVIFIANNTPHE